MLSAMGRMLLVLYTVLFIGGSDRLTAQPWAGIISQGRAIDWSAAGIPGGTPARTVICSTLTASMYGNGSADATPGIQGALNGCPSGQVVLLSSGKFRINSNITVPANVTLRGAGADQTILDAHGSRGAVVALGSSNAYPNVSSSVSVTGGATAGSSSIVPVAR